MWLITGICRKTYELRDVAVAMCEAERKRILRQEAENYFDLRAVRIRVAA
jgi:hypothetical protein